MPEARAPYQFSQRSLDRLATCDERLRRVMTAALEGAPSDFTILCGHRTEAEQAAACAAGNSKTPWPKSKHNSLPSRAVDVAPYPIDWNDLGRFRDLAHHVMEVAAELGVRLRWGGDFNMNGKPDDKFVDMPHFELLEG